MLVVAALGGNALLRRGEAISAPGQRRNIAVAAAVLADIAKAHGLVVTHGNGPQIGWLAERPLKAESEAFPLDVVGAESQGMIGYVLESELSSRLPGRQVATLLTQTVVDPKDPAFHYPTKPIGRLYSQAEARRLADEFGWTMMQDGDKFRRAVPSPRPLQIREADAIRILMEANVVVICAGGGGVPVAIDDISGAIQGVECVVDKDHSAALLAQNLAAAVLFILTDVPAVYSDWGTDGARAIKCATPSGMRRYRFAEGSMKPKVEAACNFVSETGGMAVIGSLDAATAMLRSEAGTCIRASGPEIAWYS